MGKEGSEAGNYYNQSTIKFMRYNCHALFQQKKFDLIDIFSEYLYLYSNVYFEVDQSYLENYFKVPQVIKKDNIQIDEYMFRVDVPYDLKLKKNNVEKLYKLNIQLPPFSYYKKDDQFIIQIEYSGKLEDFQIKKNKLNGQYQFSIIGKTAYNSPIKCSQINRGEFLLNFSVGLDFMTIKSNNYLIQNDDIYGILKIIYLICSFGGGDYDELEDFGDDDW